MAKKNINNIKYVCSECGYISFKWFGNCPSCNSWNSLVEDNSTIKELDGINNFLELTSVQNLSDIVVSDEFRFNSGSFELNRVLGGGIVSNSSVLVGGEPGIGKSTLLLQAASFCSEKYKVLYISGEESASQIKQRADRLKLNYTNLLVLCTLSCDVVKDVILEEKPRLVIIDSLQTLSTTESLSNAGSPVQMKTCCIEITSVCKITGSAVFFIGHVTKEGIIAGPKIIEHLVDTVLYFEESGTNIRLIRAVKNRFGSVDEVGLFTMNENGLKGIKDPSSLFITERLGDKTPPGIAYASVVEGSRVFVVEIQALVVDAKTGYSRVYSDKVDSSKVQRISAIIEKHLSVRLVDKDIYINVAGGIKVKDVSIELAVAMALLSAVLNKPLPSKMLCIGELSLAGEIRSVSYGSRRLKSAFEMGLEIILVSGFMRLKDEKVKIINTYKVEDLIKVFS